MIEGSNECVELAGLCTSSIIMMSNIPNENKTRERMNEKQEKKILLRYCREQKSLSNSVIFRSVASFVAVDPSESIRPRVVELAPPVSKAAKCTNEIGRIRNHNLFCVVFNPLRGSSNYGCCNYN